VTLFHLSAFSYLDFQSSFRQSFCGMWVVPELVAHTLRLAPAPDRAFDRAFDLDLALDRNLTYQEELSSRKRIRRLFLFGHAKIRKEDEIQQLINDLLDISMDLVILEKRILGELPACEGILIMREREAESAF
jgi:hypothetical protein